jgi:16S rRNA (guanine527-N7)-methyltransferase
VRVAPLGPEGFAELVSVSRETLARLEAYAELLIRWSARINLVGRDTLPDLWRRHILDSAQLRRLIPNSAKSLIDLGSGAGLPGLVLALLGVPGVELVEADSRKAAFLREAARITAAAVSIRPCRIQAVSPHPVNVVTARACAPLARLLGLAAPFLAPDTVCLFPKGERYNEELTLARKAWTMNVSVEQSLSDRRGVILRLQQVAREPGQA